MTYSDVSGEIYFIGEVDRLTKASSEFIKIGLVREKEGRGSQDRLSEHQTGNPRELFLIDVVATPFVDAAESMLHSFFATKRVRGEWFSLPGDEVHEAIDRARELAETLTPYGEVLRVAKELSKQVSTEAVIEPSAEVLEWHRSLLEAKARNKFVESFADLVVEEVVKAAERGEDVSSVIEVHEKKGAEKFNTEAFAVKYPDLYSQFTVTEIRFKGPFTVTGIRKLPSVSDFDPELAGLGDEITALALEVRQGLATVGTLTDKKLQLDKKAAMYDLEEEVLASRIKIACGLSEGIKGVCSWKRTSEEIPSFLRIKFKAEYPHVYQEFVTVGAPTKAKALKKQVAAE